MSRYDDAVERMTRLTFVLLGAAEHSRNPERSAAWIIEHVEGYSESKEPSTMLKRDAKDLHRVGVPIHRRSGGGDENTLYRIDRDSYRLPEISFTAEEALALSLIRGFNQFGELSRYSDTGWAKMAAAGVTSAPGAEEHPLQHVLATNDLNRLRAEDFYMLVNAVERSYRISFHYRATPTTPLTKRRMDLWGMVTQGGRVYLVGFDIDRQAPRAFRITRLREVALQRRSPEFTQPTAPLDDIVADILQPHDLIDAVLEIPEGTAQELAVRGTRRPDGRYALTGVSLDWLTRTAVGFAPEVDILEPAAARERVRELLQSAPTTTEED